jgi:hypothetical protein
MATNQQQQQQQLYNGRYTKIDELGDGQFGRVFSVRDSQDKSEPM